MSMMQDFRDGTVLRQRKARWKSSPNWIVITISQCWWTLEALYFGRHFLPRSDAEMICDGIALLIFALAFVASPIRESP